MTVQPNVLFIIADDHRYDAIGAAGDRVVKTPILDAIARTGTMMNSTHIIGGVDGAVCVPCRACIHTGTHIFQATESQTIDDHDRTCVIRAGANTMPSWFRSHGYYTHAVGKWHNDRTSFSDGFCSGNALFFGGMSDHREVPVFDYGSNGFSPPNEPRVEKQFSTELFTDAAINFLEQYSEEDPFFLYLAYTSPHDPRTAPEPYASMYNPKDIPLPPSFMEEHPFDNGELDVRDEHLADYPRRQEEIKSHIADYYAMITHMDYHIGRVLQSLADSGKLENTIVVYTADHGLAVGRHGLLGKQNVYDHSIRVPWLIQGPGIPAGRRIDQLAYQFDIFPTLCEMAGVSAPDGIAGQSVADLIRGETKQGRETVYALYKDIQRMVKDERWKMILYRRSELTGQGSDRMQLFDLKNDPWEIRNLASSTELNPQIERLQGELRTWMNRTGDPYADCFL
ncbi:sulfatase-like hydrolase/transferase [Paenibacillus sp. HJL G12]|uniref:Sulfatase-like hydrolase/transferase n=1 Tax=Paenibacillus dendrobii TaxID=2691084 RepID=A0A7X3IHN8_9BACL|nr:sulfatase-like hydrolase/transferase [Paenibacillus dendrobii]MWV42705.1 sulfatase-like hydrolase/transferase [Paenibacillus dendrobii]